MNDFICQWVRPVIFANQVMNTLLSPVFNLMDLIKKLEAKGIRNTVGFDWHPETKELWFTDNGRDLWGDDMPPEELNRVSQEGQHFGYPYEYGQGHRDGEFKVPAIEFTPAAVELPAHTAPLGMAFYKGNMFPEE